MSESSLGLDNLTSTSRLGEVGQLKVTQLCPTQMAVGKDETNEKIKRMVDMDPTDLQEYLTTHPVPVVIGNNDKFYLIDHHHLTYALWYAADNKDNKFKTDQKDLIVAARVSENWSQLRDYPFWKAMYKANWLYPFNNLGGGPLKPEALRKNVWELENDPYRSLAWYVRNKYGYRKDPTNAIFAEFKWAEFFRNRILLSNDILRQTPTDAEAKAEEAKSKKPKKRFYRTEDVLLNDLDDDDRQEIIDYAMYLAKSSEAAGLPGYEGHH